MPLHDNLVHVEDPVSVRDELQPGEPSIHVTTRRRPLGARDRQTS